ncbi:hypothetical protein SIN8267_01712 [Sinobacterium norvegicum]|uniref:Uncharacterized protein n=1 Tax=Sinobacterium norvegicum TaxID=1641715 RepID=A0ABM9AEH5_9GAMM|nr:hypothetical protein [Sinobacterium norvegicum]CAH0991603.1 hypothetical protein SIN8267_01712 [Sinobacterium norvegicum]
MNIEESKSQLLINNQYQQLNYSLLFIRNTLEQLTTRNNYALVSQLQEEFRDASAALDVIKACNNVETSIDNLADIVLVLSAVADYHQLLVDDYPASPSIARVLVLQLNNMISIDTSPYQAA